MLYILTAWNFLSYFEPGFIDVYDNSRDLHVAYGPPQILKVQMDWCILLRNEFRHYKMSNVLRSN